MCLTKACLQQLTIRLQAPDFYEAIVYKGKTQINYHLIKMEGE